jgi:hypothetical protein
MSPSAWLRAARSYRFPGKNLDGDRRIQLIRRTCDGTQGVALSQVTLPGAEMGMCVPSPLWIGPSACAALARAVIATIGHLPILLLAVMIAPRCLAGNSDAALRLMRELRLWSHDVITAADTRLERRR